MFPESFGYGHARMLLPDVPENENTHCGLWKKRVSNKGFLFYVSAIKKKGRFEKKPAFGGKRVFENKTLEVIKN